jgi:hypothetical protein
MTKIVREPKKTKSKTDKNIDTSTVKSDAESEDENDMEEVQSNIDAKFPEEVATDDPSVPIDGKLVDKFHIEKPLPKAP